MQFVREGEETISYPTTEGTYINYAPLTIGHYVYYNEISMYSFFIQRELDRNNLKIGDSVIYVPNHISFMDYRNFEYGIITSFNSDKSPFVKYFNFFTKQYKHTSQLTNLNNIYPYKQYQNNL